MNGRYGLLLGVLGLGILGLAVGLGIWGGPAAWGGASFLGVAAGYLGAGPGVFGKRKDGSLAAVNRAVLLPYLACTWGVWELQRRLGGEAVWSEVRPGLWIGRRPLGGEIPEAARLVIDLTCEFGELPAAIGDRRYVNLPTLDAGTPDAAQFRAAVREALGCEGGVYVHCALGHGRSALFVAALLMARGDADSVEDAEARIRAVRPAVRLNGLQRRFVERWTAESE